MPHRKAAKHSGVTTYREAFPSSDDEDGHDERVTEWIKSTTRTVYTDVQASSRSRKKTRFAEEDEEIETSLDIFSDIVQNQQFSAWLDSSEQDNVPDDYSDYGNDGDDGEPNSASQPSGRNSNVNLDDASDRSSVDSKDDVDSPVHDLSDFAAEQAKVRLLNFCIHSHVDKVASFRPKFCWTGSHCETLLSMN